MKVLRPSSNHLFDQDVAIVPVSGRYMLGSWPEEGEWHSQQCAVFCARNQALPACAVRRGRSKVFHVLDIFESLRMFLTFVKGVGWNMYGWIMHQFLPASSRALSLVCHWLRWRLTHGVAGTPRSDPGPERVRALARGSVALG